jgi:hypothetical protein
MLIEDKIEKSQDQKLSPIKIYEKYYLKKENGKEARAGIAWASLYQ